MRFLRHRIISYFVLAMFLSLPVIGMATTVFACNGSNCLTESGPGSNVLATPVTLNGTNLTTTYALPVTVSDTRSNNNGWNLTITFTPFSTSGSMHSFSTASTINPAPTVVCTGTCTLPQSDGTIQYPLTVQSGGSAKYYNANKNTGVGTMTVTAIVAITIPANSYKGTYTSTLTLAIIAGP